MTMKVYFNEDKDGHKKGEARFVERSLARRFCENGIAIPYQKHLDNIYEAEQANIEKEKNILAEKEKAKKEKDEESKKGSKKKEVKK